MPTRGFRLQAEVQREFFRLKPEATVQREFFRLKPEATESA
jgi:hypothetical protein